MLMSCQYARHTMTMFLASPRPCILICMQHAPHPMIMSLKPAGACPAHAPFAVENLAETELWSCWAVRIFAPVQIRTPSTPYDPPDHHLRGGGSANAASRPAFTPSRLQYTNVFAVYTNHSTPVFDNHKCCSSTFSRRWRSASRR